MAQGTAKIPVVFTSWKEIASYLGKGVRTVQRWETEFGLPVQRPDERKRGIIRASQVELDRWISTHWSQRSSERLSFNAEVEELRKVVAELVTENASLRQELQERKEAGYSADLSDVVSTEMKLLLDRCERLLMQTHLMHQQFAETLDLTRTLRELRALARQGTERFDPGPQIH